MRIGKSLLTLIGALFASIGTLLFQPTVFSEITLPIAAKLLGWKAQAVSARLSPFGTLEIQGFEAVNPRKSRIAMDSAKVEFDPVTVLTGRPEILRADVRLAMVDVEWVSVPEEKGKKAAMISLPFSLREASVDLVEGRLRTETGAWILKSAHAATEGWDGRSPQEIRLQLGHLDWSGPGKQELTTTTQATAQKSKDSSGGEVWQIKLATDVATVVDLPPWNLVSPCQLVVEGSAVQGRQGDWRVDGLRMVWQGVGGIRLATKIGGSYAPEGNWAAKLDLEPTDLQLAGIFLQPRGIQNVSGTVGGAVSLRSGPRQPLQVGVELNGQGVQLTAAGGPTWPAQPAALGISSRAEWREADGSLAVESLLINLGRLGQPADFQLSLDQPAVVQLAGKSKAESAQPASLLWTAQGLELAAVAPIFVSPENLKVEGGKLSASGQAKIEGEKIRLNGRVESRSMSASGRWVQGQLALQSALLDFQGYLEKMTKLHLENARLSAAWEGGVAEDLAFTAKVEWDTAKREGFLAGDMNTGLAGLGKAWAGAKFWPEDGQAKAHVEFSGNPAQKGEGLFSASFRGMRWPGEKAAAWGADCSSEIRVEKGIWTVPELVLKADRTGESLVEGKISAGWSPDQNQGRIRVELARAQSAFVVPLLKNFTPEWQWTEASGRGSFQFIRQDQHDRVEAELQATVTVDTGTVARPRPVDFSSVQGNLKASWPSGVSGVFSVESLDLVAKHRDGTEAVRASLDAPLQLEKKGPGDWKTAGRQPCSGLVQFAGWPVGLLAPLVLPEAKENSVTGTLSGFLKVRSDPQKGNLAAQVDLSCPDFSLQLPRVQLRDNRTSVKAQVELGSDRTLTVRKVSATSRQGDLDWINLSAEKTDRPELAVKGNVDLTTLGQVVPVVAPYVSRGSVVLEANVGESKSGVRRLGLSSQAKNLTLTLPAIGTAAGLEVKAVGMMDWGPEGPVFLDDLELTANGLGGTLQIGKMDWKRGGAVSWESARIPGVWMAFFCQSWMKPNRWVRGDLVLGQGFWEPGDHGSSGQIDATLLEASLSDQKKLAPLSVRLGGDWEYDNRTHFFILKDASVLFPEFRDQPVQIPSLQTGPGLFQIKMAAGVLDLRGILDQYEAWQPSPMDPGLKAGPMRIDITANLDQVILSEARVGPVNIPRFRYGPEGILLESSSVGVKGGVIRGSVVQTGGADKPLQARLFVERFPLGAILGPMIEDARGPVGGLADLDFTGQAAGARIEDLQRTLSGQGRSLRLYQAHLENLPAIGKALQGAGQFLGSSFIAGSEINGVGGTFQVAGSRITTQDLQASGTALAAGMRGSLDWVSQAIDFQVKLALTREAIQSSGQLQGVMTQLVGSSTDYYTKIPGSARITGTLSDPQVQMDLGKMLAEGGINLLMNAPAGVLQGAGGAAGGAAGAAGSILQGVGNLFKGF